MRPESRVGPGQEIPDDPLLNRPLLQKHPPDIVAEESRYRLRLQCALHREEGAIPPEQAPGHQEMHVRMPVQEIPGALQARHGVGDGCAASRGSLEEILDRLVGQAGEPGEALPPTEEGP